MTPAGVWATVPRQTEGATVRPTWRDKAAAGLWRPAGVMVHVSHIFVNPIFSCLPVDSAVLKHNKGMRSRSCSLPLPDLFFTCARFVLLAKVLPVVFLQISRIIEQGPPLMHGDMF